MPPLPTYEEALAKTVDRSPTLAEERVPLARALGRVLRQDVRADRDQPPFDRSAMDGFAVRSAEVTAGAAFPVVGSVAAGGAPASFQEPIALGTARRIATGAPLPVGADAVVPIEQAVVDGGGPTPQAGAIQETVRFLLDTARPWQNVHRRASDAAASDLVLRAGTRLGPQHLGIAASMGLVEVPVPRQPRITLLTTGDEVVPPGTLTEALQPQQIRNSNGPMLAALMASLLPDVELHHVHLPDEPEQTLAAAREALSRSQLVLTVGGVSVGQRDFLPAAWQRLGLEALVHGVAIQPGKPVLVACPPDRDANRIVVGLPGNPVSVLCTAHLFVWPLLRRMLGQTPPELPWRRVRLAEPVKASSKREVFRAATVDADNTARAIQWHGSGDLMHTAAADGFVRLPLQDGAVPTGTELRFLPLVH